MSRTALVILAEGFEEIEAVAVIDILRRAGVDVTVAGLPGLEVAGAHGIRIKADALLADAVPENWDAVVLPGGMPGTSNLLESAEVRSLIVKQHRSGKPLAAICAAPSVLAAAGILDGKNATCYPGVEDSMRKANLRKDSVVVDGNLITSCGVGTAIEFSLRLVQILAGAEASMELRAKLLAE